MIAPMEQGSGLQKNLKPFAIPDTAFARMQNAYVFRGRVRKRFGSYLMSGTVAHQNTQQLYSRLRIKVDTTDNVGAAAGTVPGVKFKVGQLFSIGDQIFTVYQLGTPAFMLVTTPPSATGTYNTTTGAYVITGATPLTDVYFYPSEPVMGLLTYETSQINNNPVYAFDTQFAYQYVAGAWLRLGTGSAATWTGSNANFFWGENYRGAFAYNDLLFVTNFTSQLPSGSKDNIRYWDNSAWTNYKPLVNATDTLTTALMLVSFKNRLLALNTIEFTGGQDQFFPNRLRYSWIGDPTTTGGTDAWRDDLPGHGGFVDAPVKQSIVSLQILKDRLIVFCSDSTWEVVYTQNELFPFRWQQINTELGVEATFSQVPFDKVILGIGNTGINACNGSSVERIDEKIPDDVFDIHNDNDGVKRVYGIRDYFSEMVYWTFPSADATTTVYPNRVLAYNYRSGSWAYNDDSITCFGYYRNQNDLTWAIIYTAWQSYNTPWQSPELQSKFKQVLAGNQQGFVFVVDIDESTNAPALQITNFSVSGNTATFTVIDHNLSIGDFVKIYKLNGITGLNGLIFKIFQVSGNNISVIITAAPGTYTGGGTLARVSKIDILTKQYNFYADKGRNAYVSKVDFLVDRTPNGEITVETYTSTSTDPLGLEAVITGSQVGTSILETTPYALVPYEASQEQLWHPVYFQADGEYVQLQFTMSDVQMTNIDIAESDFQLHAFTITAEPTSRLQ